MPDIQAFRRPVLIAFWGSLIGSLAILGLDAALGSFGVLRTQILLHLVGLFTATIVCRIAISGWATHRRLAEQVLISVTVSQICYYILVWTRWKLDPLFWRAWWVSMVASVTLAHLLMIARVTQKPRDPLARFTFATATAAGFLIASLALRRRIPPGPIEPIFWWVYALPAAGSVVGSLLLWRRETRRTGPRPPMTRAARIAWLVATHAGIFLAGFYLAMGSRGTNPYEVFPSALAGMSAEELDRQIRTDFDRLKTVVQGSRDLHARSSALMADLAARRRDEGRDYYRPDEEDQIRWNFVTYLSYRSALLRMVATYADFASVREPEPRARCFMLGYTAAVTAYEAALVLITAYGHDPAAKRKLNEEEKSWGLRANLFDEIYQNAANEKNLKQCHEMGAYYATQREAWRGRDLWAPEDFDWLDTRIREGLNYVRTHEVSRTKAWLAKLIDRVKDDAYRPIYSAQSILSTWIGDFRITQDAPFITLDQIEKEVQPKLQPGDILLERRNWYLSNAFLPGFWPHGALYVGTMDDLRKLGIADHPAVRQRLEEYLRPAEDGRPHTVIESVSEGVVFNSLTHSMHADYVAVFRPRLAPAQIAEAITRAFTHVGKPYDFEFDFFTSDKLVCTELVYRAYEGFLRFDLVRVMGRDTLPALEIVKKFSRELAAPKRELDFVLFLDAAPGERRAFFADEKSLCESVNRPQAFND